MEMMTMMTMLMMIMIMSREDERLAVFAPSFQPPRPSSARLKQPQPTAILAQLDNRLAFDARSPPARRPDDFRRTQVPWLQSPGTMAWNGAGFVVGSGDGVRQGGPVRLR